MNGRPKGAPGTRYRVYFHPAALKEYQSLEDGVRKKFEGAIDLLEADPFTKRPGCDIKRLLRLDDGSILHRLRVGHHRACYVVVTSQEEVWVLLFDARGRGYTRMKRRATRRSKKRDHGD